MWLLHIPDISQRSERKCKMLFLFSSPFKAATCNIVLVHLLLPLCQDIFFNYTLLYLLQMFWIQNYFLKLLGTRRYNSLLFCFRTYYSSTTVYLRQFALIFLQPILQMRHKIEALDAYRPNPATFTHLFKSESCEDS